MPNIKPWCWPPNYRRDRVMYIPTRPAHLLEYQEEMIDAKRLEWDEKMYGGKAKDLSGYYDNQFYSEKYDPSKDIMGSYKTRRVYGAMAGYDEPQKIVTGLQLLQAGIIVILTE